MSRRRKPVIRSLQALRGIAFLMVFLSHSHLSLQGGAWGVSVFFVLSGFLMYYQYEDQEFSVSIPENIYFAVSRLKKIYPLHLTMFAISIPFEVGRSLQNGTNGLSWYYLKVLFGVTLTESWHPSFWIYGAFNGVAWFLSTCMFLYFCFPYLQKMAKRVSGGSPVSIASKKAAVKSTDKMPSKFSTMVMIIVIMMVIWLLQVLWIWLTRNVAFETYPDINYWLAYTFPPTRLGDFAVGVFAGALYSRVVFETREQGTQVEEGITSIAITSETVLFTALELATIAVTFTSFRFYVSQRMIQSYNWFRYAALWVPSAVVMILLFAVKKGVITSILDRKPLVWLGNISQYTYLVHSIVILYIRDVAESFFRKLGIDMKPESLRFNLLTGAISFLITILGALLYRQLQTAIRNKKNEQQ